MLRQILSQACKAAVPGQQSSLVAAPSRSSQSCCASAAVMGLLVMAARPRDGVATPSSYWRRGLATTASSPPEGEQSTPAASPDAAALVGTEVAEGVATITIMRRKALNALNMQVMHEIVAAAEGFDSNPDVKAMIITGAGEKAFAAGADIKEMSSKDYAKVYREAMFNPWDRLRHVRKPMIAAVNGYALGGGCELAMMCDIILAADSASFGQPELTLGVIPGMGGTQRLTRLVGRAKAMDLILTTRRIKADEAERIGLVSRVVPAEKLQEEALSVAKAIARFPAAAVAKAKECVHLVDEASLTTGLQFERREFWSAFALQGQQEGMAAFLEKRDPEWTE